MDINIINLIAILILVVITAWYARSTAHMLEEMRRHSQLLSISIATSVEAGITQLPSPEGVSAAHNEAYRRLLTLRKKIYRLMDELD